MRIDVVFAYAATGLPERALKPRPVACLSSTQVEIAEVAGRDVEVSFLYDNKPPSNHAIDILQYHPHLRKSGPEEPVTVVEHDGRLFAKAFSRRTGAAVQATEWAQEQHLSRGRHIARHRDTPEIPDLLGLAGLPLLPSEENLKFPIVFAESDPLDWPLERQQNASWMRTDLPSHGFDRIVRNHHDHVAAEVAKRAGRLLSVDGLMYRETAEPVWILDKRFMDVVVGDVDDYLAGKGSWHSRPVLPFVDYETFRIDEKQTLVDTIDRERESQYPRMTRDEDVAWCRAGARGFRADPMAGLLDRLLATTDELVTIAIGAKNYGRYAQDDRRFHDAPYFARAMAGLKLPGPRAGRGAIERAVKQIAKRLDFMPTGNGNSDSFRKFADATRRAAVRIIRQEQTTEPADETSAEMPLPKF